MWNLILNAIQAMDKSGTIEVGCQWEGKHRAKIWVADQGVGMTDEVMGRLFEPFFTTKDRGTGLGLATAYKIVEAHQGEIRVQSKVGQGTRFDVFFAA
jgi:signal transduction histidine kinase